MSQINAKPSASGDAAPLQAWRLADAAATAALGAELAARLPSGAILLLNGDLGAGKTCLVQGLAMALGIREPITSPTFALSQHYGGERADGSATALVHLDLYRLEDSASADELFAQEEEEARALGALLAVEWPQRLTLPPAGAWCLELSLLDPTDPDAGRQGWLTPPPLSSIAPAAAQTAGPLQDAHIHHPGLGIDGGFSPAGRAAATTPQ